MTILRSLMFVPGNREKMLLKTPTVDADAVIWDLEDAVLWDQKDEARALVERLMVELASDIPESVQVFVRINQLASEMLEDDLKAVAWPRLDGIMLPKCESANDIERVDTALTSIESARGLDNGGIAILALVETPLGVIRAYDVASASPRVMGLCFGAEDFTKDQGVSRTREGIEIRHARGAIVLAAGAAHVQVIDTVHTNLGDLEDLAEDALTAKSLGFTGKLAIHPKQVGVINRVFSPSDDELDFARRVVAAFEASEGHGGVVLVDGKMVDKPVVERAMRLLEDFDPDEAPVE